jgi:hypothetical protein
LRIIVGKVYKEIRKLNATELYNLLYSSISLVLCDAKAKVWVKVSSPDHGSQAAAQRPVRRKEMRHL